MAASLRTSLLSQAKKTARRSSLLGKSSIFGSVFGEDSDEDGGKENEEGLIDTVLGEDAEDEAGVTLPEIDPSAARRKTSYSESANKLTQKHSQTRLLLTQKLFHGEDRFKNLTGVWLAGGAKGEVNLEDDEDEELEDLDEEDYANLSEERKEALQAKAQAKLEKEQYAEDEARRIRQLANDAQGHIAWSRGHSLRSDLIPSWQVARRNSDKEETARRMFRLGPGKHWLSSANEEIWYKAYMPSSGKVWCWSEQIVNEVRFQAESTDMPLAWMSVKAAQRAYRKNPDFKLAVHRHVVAVNNEGYRFLWSQAFAQMLEVYHRQQGFVEGDVRCTLKELRDLQPGVKFPVPGIYPAEKKRKAVTVPVPKAFPKSRLANVGARGPVPPPLPERLGCRIPYDLDPEQPWSGILATKEQQEELEYQVQQLRNAQADESEEESQASEQESEQVSEMWSGSGSGS